MGDFDDLEDNFDAFVRPPAHLRDDSRGISPASRKHQVAMQERGHHRIKETALLRRRSPHEPSLAHGKSHSKQSESPK